MCNIKINEIVVKKLETVFEKKDVNKGILYLLSERFNLNITFSEGVKTKVDSLNIYNSDKWNIPLFQQEEITDLKWDWVQSEYLVLFKSFEKHNRFKRESVNRMQKLFSNNPDIRKDEVLQATRYYIQECLNAGRISKFVKEPHNFITKGRGKDATFDILTYIDIVRQKSEIISHNRVGSNAIK